jgi:hypothetical protein
MAIYDTLKKAKGKVVYVDLENGVVWSNTNEGLKEGIKMVQDYKKRKGGK